MESNMFQTLQEYLDHWSEIYPHKKAFTFVQEDGTELESVTFQQLKEKAIALAQYLTEKGLSGKNIILSYSQGIDFVVANFACYYCSSVAIPVYPALKEKFFSKVRKIYETSDAAACLADSRTAPAMKQCLESVLNDIENEFIISDKLSLGIKDTPLDRPTENELAMLQYTSGSTSAPKGVMLTHKNLVHDINMLKQATGSTETDVQCTWLPHFHDMGLIGHLLHSIISGNHCIIINPSTFIKNPALWLQTISRYRVTMSGGPNFGYRHCFERLKGQDLSNIDLSTWRVAYTAAEPIHYEDMQSFTEVFKSSGFKESAFYPCYGLAEAAVFLTGGLPDNNPKVLKVNLDKLNHEGKAEISNDPSAKATVACGKAWGDLDVQIVDPNTFSAKNAFEVGEIWAKGSNITNGYWNAPGATEKAFAALKGETDKYLRTGDLGFMDESGEIYIAGRIKELIIINGVNYYPSDIERHIEDAFPSLRHRSVATFSIPSPNRSNESKVTIAVELDRHFFKELSEDKDKLQSLASNISKEVSEAFEITVDDIVLLKPLGILKTSSGKIARTACAQAYLKKELPVIHSYQQCLIESQKDNKRSFFEENIEYTRNLDNAQLEVFKKVTQFLGTSFEDTNLSLSIFAYGVDSIKIVDLHSQLEKQFGCTISSFAFFNANSLKGLIEDVANDIKGTDWALNTSIFKEDLATVSQLSEALTLPVVKNSANDKKALLTGATGFVGGYLLQELVESTENTIYCITRSESSEAGLKRILDNVNSYGIEFTEEQLRRIHIVCGDISKDFFGLDSETYDRLSQEVDDIYHCAAMDNFYLPYELVRKANVQGVDRIIQFAKNSKVKPIFYTSSCAASLFKEDPMKTPLKGLVTGYAQSKYVAEKLVLNQINKAGLPAVNYRLGYLYSNGLREVDHEEAFETLIDSMHQMGVVPSFDAQFDLTSVEYAVKCMVKTAKEYWENPATEYVVYNPCPLKWKDIRSALKKLNPTIQEVTREEFVTHFQAYVEKSSEKRVKPLKGIVTELLAEQLNSMFENQRADFFEEFKSLCPPCDESFTENYIRLVLNAVDESAQ